MALLLGGVLALGAAAPALGSSGPVALVNAGVVSGGINSGATSPQSFAVVQAVAAGDFVSVIIAKGFGLSSTPITSVTDSAGNTYNVDVSYAPGGFGNAGIAVASSVLTHALSTSDTLTVAWSGTFGSDSHAWVYGSSFTGVSSLDVAGVAVSGGGGAISASVTPSAGDLVLGYSVQYGTPNTNASSPWTVLMTNPGPGSSAITDGAYLIAPNGSPETYTTSGPGGGDSAAVAAAYTTSLTGAGVSPNESLGANGGPYGLENSAECSTGQPVNCATGNFTHTFVDLAVPGRGLPLSMTRTYNSLQASTKGIFGYGWTSSYEVRLTFDSAGDATVHQEDGAQATFPSNGSGGFTAPARVLGSLVKNGDGTYTLTRRGRESLVFSSTGALQSETDLNGYTTTLSYNGSGQVVAVTDPEGRSLTFGYGSNGLVSSVTDANVSGNTRTVSYGYDGSGDLTSVQDVNGGITDMAYDSSHGVVLLRAPDFHGNGSLPTSGPATCSSTPTVDTLNMHYNSRDQVDCQWDPMGRETTFSYGLLSGSGAETTTITDPKTNQTVENYTNGILTSLTRGAGTSSAATWQYTFDPTLGVSSVTDPNTNVWTYQYDANGNQTLAQDPRGHMIQRQFNAFDEPTQVTDGLHVMTTYAYDARGNLLSTSTPLTNTTATATNCASPSAPVPIAQVTCYAYGNPTFPGDLTQMTDADRNVTYFHHDANGYIDEVKDPLGHVTATVRNNDGWVTATYSPKAGCTWGSSAPVGCSSSYETQYSYVIPGGSAVDEFGDVGTITDPLGHTTKYSYDADRNLVSIIDGDGNTTTNAYDSDNERCWTLPGGTSSNSCASPPTNARVTDYNPDGTLADFKDGKGNTTGTFGYNSRGEVTSTTDALGNVTSYTRDGDGNVLTKLDPISGATCTGTLVGCTTYTYYTDNELKTIFYSDNPSDNVSNITYDSDGQRTAMTDGTGSSSWSYDSLHRSTSYTNGNGAIVSYGYTFGAGPTYDVKDQVRSIAYPNSAGTVTQSWKADGTLASVSDWNGKLTTFAYNFDGNQIGQTSPSTAGVTDTFGFNAADEMASVSDSNGGTLFSATYTRDGNGQVASDSSQATKQANYKYTVLNQLCYAGSATTTACTSPPSSSYPYAYDNADNLTTMENAAHTATNTQQYNSGDELCWTFAGTTTNACSSTPTGASTYTFDNKGNRTHIAPSTGAQTCNTIDQANRLTKIQTGTGSTCSFPTTVASYSYDGDGIRESKTVGSTTTYFTSDGLDGNLLQQNDVTTKTSFIYGPGGIPVEQIAGTTTTYLHHDQLGSIRLITDAAGATQTATTRTWDPYGNQATSSGTLTIPFGYAGQYTDPETGLQYLRARYYDPSTAQFLTRDPIEQLTREPYSYAGDNPISNTDPSGLDCADPTGALCAIGGYVSQGVGALGSAAQTVAHAGLDAVAFASYGVYWLNYQTANAVQSVSCDLGVPALGRALALPLVPGQVAGLAGDAAIDWVKGQTVNHESTNDEGPGSLVHVNSFHQWIPGGPVIHNAPGIGPSGHWDIAW